eukprot:comp15457_c0_seq1/m.12432 comp15457_c0_seq1/g.12432  ORF comp15457_c0_seq1/g.12432 comp15457_c0_seq1/m.12432 type:complete len:491 (-) comp15457_c0_seq1:6-1478(-)
MTLLGWLAAVFTAWIDMLLDLWLPKKAHPHVGATERTAVVGGGIAGCGAAWHLHKSGTKVVLYEGREKVGGNARTHQFTENGKTVTTGLSVLAWPRDYFRHYRHLLDTLQIPITPVSLPFFIHVTDGQNGVFAHEMDSEFKRKYGGDVERWNRMVRFVRATNEFFNGPTASLYHMSVFNFLNIVSLRTVAWLFGVSTQFWDYVVVALYSSAFLTDRLNTLPASIVPVLEDLMPVSRTPNMDTWVKNSEEVFEAMLRGVDTRRNTKVTSVARLLNGQLRLVDDTGGVEDYDRVVFACSAPDLLDIVKDPSWLQTALCSSVDYDADDRGCFLEGKVHSDTTALPPQWRDTLLSKYANYIEVRRDPSGQLQYENTFVYSSWVPEVKASGVTVPMMTTYNTTRTLSKVRGKVDNRRCHPHLSVKNLLLSVGVFRFLQGRGGMYYIGNIATPGNGHDLSLLSALVVCHHLGAPYPFAKDPLARADFERLRSLMGL